MAAGSIPRPGKKHGPCAKPCDHIDCKESRDMASAECPICGKAIGYEVAFYFDHDNDGKPTHALCLEEKIEKERG